jgi:hypothetical protein
MREDAKNADANQQPTYALTADAGAARLQCLKHSRLQLASSLEFLDDVPAAWMHTSNAVEHCDKLFGPVATVSHKLGQ